MEYTITMDAATYIVTRQFPEQSHTREKLLCSMAREKLDKDRSIDRRTDHGV